jgi:hypothetical protein
LKPVHFATCVWGHWHLDMLIRIVWPCLLAEGNLPAFMRQGTATYRICTTRSDQSKLRQAPGFQPISRLLPIEFIDTPTERPEPQFHMDRFMAAMQEAHDDHAIFFNVWPDVVFANNTLDNAARAIKKGAAGCMLPSLRVVSETCVEDVLNAFSTSPDAAISIASGDLVRLGVRHMHPLSITGVANALHGRPETGLMFRVRGEGLISRTCGSNWLFMDPERLNITADGAILTSDPNPARMVHIVADSDDLFFLSLAPLYKELETFRPRHSNDVLDIARLTMLPHVKISPFIEPLDRISMRLHYGAMNEAAWRPVLQQSEAALRRVRMMRALMQIWELLREHGCRQASRLISLALFTIPLPTSFLIEQPVTIFAPSDDAIAALPPGEFSRLVDRKFRRELLTAILGHVGADGPVAAGEGGTQYRSAAGGAIHLQTAGSEVVLDKRARIMKDLRSGPHRVCIIDQVLGLAGRAERVRRPRRACHA